MIFVDDSQKNLTSARAAQYDVYEADSDKKWVLNLQAKIDSLPDMAAIPYTIKSTVEVLEINKRVAQEASEVGLVSKDGDVTVVKLALVPIKKKRPSK